LKNEAFKNQAIREARNRRLDALIKNEVADLSQEFDIDLIDMQDYKFIAGEQVEVYNKRLDKLSFA